MLAREGQVYIATVDDQVSVTIFDMGIRKVVEEIRVPLHKAVSSLEFDGDTLIEHGNSSARVLQLRPHVTVSKQKYGSRFPDLATIR
jgi:sugar lactone lactonase YvrE